MYEVCPITMSMELSRRLHSRQRRKYTGEPYIRHPYAVAGLVASAIPLDEDAICAAFLHDILEESNWTVFKLLNLFGKGVSSLVDQVTDISTVEDGKRCRRKFLDIQHLRIASPVGKTIKLADMIDNMPSVIKYDPKFAVVYMAEKRQTLRVLREGDQTLFQVATDIVEGYYEKA